MRRNGFNLINLFLFFLVIRKKKCYERKSDSVYTINDSTIIDNEVNHDIIELEEEI